MPRQKSLQPGYRFHISGQARVTLNGKDYLLGKHGSPESWAKYHSLIGEYLANGFTLPDDEGDKPSGVVVRMADQETTLRHVVADFRARVLPQHIHNEGQYHRFRSLCELIEEKHGDDEPSDFGPRKLEALRDGFIKRGNCRRYVNDLVKDIIRIVEHGVSRELVPATVIVGLRSLKPLRPGQARESVRPRVPSRDQVEAVLPHCTGCVGDMLLLQLLTACRPGELFTMEPSHIDRSGATWFYVPPKHKTAHKRKVRVIPIVGQACDVLAKYLFRDGLCFVNRAGTAWNRDIYRNAVERACDRAKVERFTPYSLRHLGAQTVRDRLGVESVQSLLGHARCDTSEIYSEASRERAVEAARALQA